jgi:hypothetical protein
VDGISQLIVDGDFNCRFRLAIGVTLIGARGRR